MFSTQNKKFLIFLFFLALSTIFWLLMTLNESYEKELPIVVRIGGVPKNVVMTTAISDTVYATVRDKGFVLLSYDFGNKLHPIVLNFSTYANKQTGRGAVPLPDLHKYIRQQLFASTAIVSIKAERLNFFFNYGLNKQVQVKLAGHIIPADNYYLSHIRFIPQKVVVYAAAEKLDSITAVVTEYQNIVNFSDTVIRTVKLKPIVGAKIVPQTVRLALYPDVLTETSVEVPIQAINTPPGIVIRTFPHRVRVNFTVGASMYRMINPDDFSVVADYREIAARPSDKCTLRLQKTPRGITKARLEVSQVDYLIEK